MKRSERRSGRTVAILALACALGLACEPADGADERVYERKIPSLDGIGKVYLGREISAVMGHRAASWLERPERDGEERPDEVVTALGLAPTDRVADIGAGTGYFTFRLVERVPRGRVYAVDIQQEMLDRIVARAAAEGVPNVAPVLGEIDDPKLPAEIDLVLMVDAYHEFSHPREMMEAVVAALTPGGRVVLVEYRGEDPEVPIKELHKMTEAQARREMETVGLAFVENRSFLPWQHFLVFEKPAADPS